MNMSLNKILFLLLALIIIAGFYTSKKSPPISEVVSPSSEVGGVNNPNASDKEICAELQNPALLPYISYNTTEGFNQCVARCVNSAMIQICPQLPPDSNVFTTNEELKKKILDGCTEHIQEFISKNIRCPYVKCEP
jgi:hypothetical protein